MDRPTPARPRVEELEAREVPALGLDTSFAAGGFAVDPVGGGRFSYLTAAAFGPDAVVAAGALVGSGPWGSGGEVAVARTIADGTADTGFGGGDGLATFTFATPHTATAVFTQVDGKVLVAGNVTTADGTGDVFVMRLNYDGSRDTSFGVNGEAVIDFGGNDDVSGVAVQADGRVVVAGSTSGVDSTGVGVAPRIALARLTAAGLPDASFGTAGEVVTADAGGAWSTTNVVVRPGGRIVVGGYTRPDGFGSTTQFVVRQFTSVGAADAAFGTGGRAAVTFAGTSFATAADMVLLDDGRAVIGGGGSSVGLLAWFSPTGGVIAQEQFSEYAGAMGEIADLVVAPLGGVRAIGAAGVAIEEHPAPGSASAPVLLNPGPEYVSGIAVLAQSLGKLLVVGHASAANNSDPYAPGGSLLLTRFADGGATSGPATSVRWNTPHWIGPNRGPVYLSAGAVPLFGDRWTAVYEGTITFKESGRVLGSITLAPPTSDLSLGLRSVGVPLSNGLHTIVAEYSGSSRWAASSAALTIEVGHVTTTSVTLTASDPQPYLDGGRVLHALLLRDDGGFPPSSGTVSFYAGATLLGATGPLIGGDAYLNIAADALPPGTYSLRAVYEAEPGSPLRESAPIALTIRGATVATETTLTAAAAAAVVGAPFALTAKVRGAGAPVSGGTVTFTDGTTVLGAAPVGADGVATFTTALRLGTRSVRAAYSGTVSALASNSAALSVAVGRAPTATDLAASTRTFTPGQAVTLTAAVRVTAGSAFPVGTVEFRDGTRVLGTAQLDGRGQAKLVTTALTAGTHTITAVYVGSSTCAGSTSAAVALSSGRATTTTALTAAVAAPVFGQPQTLTARVTGATAGRVDFFDGQVLIGSAAVDASGAAALTIASNLGAHRYRAVFVGTDAADTSASGWMSQTVAKALPAVTVVVASDGSVRATVRAPFGGAPIGTVTVKVGTTVLGTAAVDGNGVATFRPTGRLAPGTYRVTAAYSGSSCFLGGASDLFDVTV